MASSTTKLWTTSGNNLFERLPSRIVIPAGTRVVPYPDDLTADIIFPDETVQIITGFRQARQAMWPRAEEWSVTGFGWNSPAQAVYTLLCKEVDFIDRRKVFHCTLFDVNRRAAIAMLVPLILEELAKHIPMGTFDGPI